MLLVNLNKLVTSMRAASGAGDGPHVMLPKALFFFKADFSRLLQGIR